MSLEPSIQRARSIQDLIRRAQFQTRMVPSEQLQTALVNAGIAVRSDGLRKLKTAIDEGIRLAGALVAEQPEFSIQLSTCQKLLKEARDLEWPPSKTTLARSTGIEHKASLLRECEIGVNLFQQLRQAGREDDKRKALDLIKKLEETVQFAKDWVKKTKVEG